MGGAGATGGPQHPRLVLRPDPAQSPAAFGFPGGISLLRQREWHRGLTHLRPFPWVPQAGERLGAGGSTAAGPEPALCTDPSWLADWERFGFTTAPCDRPEGEEELVTPDATYTVRHGTGVPGGGPSPPDPPALPLPPPRGSLPGLRCRRSPATAGPPGPDAAEQPPGAGHRPPDPRPPHPGGAVPPARGSGAAGTVLARRAGRGDGRGDRQHQRPFSAGLPADHAGRGHPGAGGGRPAELDRSHPPASAALRLLRDPRGHPAGGSPCAEGTAGGGRGGGGGGGVSPEQRGAGVAARGGRLGRVDGLRDGDGAPPISLC
ncbi:translation initiation factor IF-2-like [Accipiter gentilis]|uniref:translation initiation factor IF-2-like n=1 Tax=Astur gentilis TaxID=8957 RepID=UPI00210F6A89|nr:translation initiation factor IF-2-like [Accipiter gentilis]